VQLGVGDHALAVDRVRHQRDALAGRVQQPGVALGEHGFEREPGALVLPGGRDRQPGDRLAAQVAAGHHVVEQVLEAARERPGIFGSAEQHGVGGRDLLAYRKNRRRRGLTGNEGGQVPEAAVKLGHDPRWHQLGGRAQRGRLRRRLGGAARDHE
jgi:hypothetical protein